MSMDGGDCLPSGDTSARLPAYTIKKKNNIDPIKWPLLTKSLCSLGEGLSINHHACSMRVGDFKYILRTDKPKFPHYIFLHDFFTVMAFGSHLTRKYRMIVFG
uniref:SFRICE_021113 n=1 Tax=Spodoptera frugiperda TaxID=7108 RepID=A0A2H1WK06_SPOFR